MATSARIGGMTKSELLRRLDGRGVQLNEAARALFQDDRWTTLARPRVVQIVVISVLELGFQKGATYRELVAKTRQSQLAECPIELGP